MGYVGQSVKRVEDPRFIQGKGSYVANLHIPGMVYLAVKRSPYGHAKIKKIDTKKAMALPGVVGVFTGLWGLIFMPFLGAVIGQYIVDRDMIRARDVGFATWLGMAIGTVAKVAIAFLMIGIFIAALLIP